MLWPALFVLGYLVSGTGSAFIVLNSLRAAMGFDSDPENADLGIMLWLLLGAGLLWPLALVFDALYRRAKFLVD